MPVTLHIVDLFQYYCKIRCNPMHPLYGALLVPYEPVRVEVKQQQQQQLLYNNYSVKIWIKKQGSPVQKIGSLVPSRIFYINIRILLDDFKPMCDFLNSCRFSSYKSCYTFS